MMIGSTYSCANACTDGDPLQSQRFHVQTCQTCVQAGTRAGKVVSPPDLDRVDLVRHIQERSEARRLAPCRRIVMLLLSQQQAFRRPGAVRMLMFGLSCAGRANSPAVAS